MTKNALSQLVDRTERRHLVSRASSEQDRRVIMLSVTPTGKVLAEAVFAEMTKRLPDVAENLDADDQRDFERLATAIVDASGVSASTSSTPDRAVLLLHPSRLDSSSWHELVIVHAMN